MNCPKCGTELVEGANFCHQCGRNLHPKPTHRGHGEGTVYRRGRTWTAEVTRGYKMDPLTGKVTRLRKTKGGFKTKTEALNYIQVLKQDTTIEYKLLTLWNIFERGEFEKKSPKMQTQYKKAWSRLQPFYYQKINEIKPDELQLLLDAYSHDQAKDIKTLLRALYQIAILRDAVTVNKADYLKLPPAKTEKQPPFTVEEINKIWHGWNHDLEFCGYILTMIYTGMRPNELLKTEISMINYDTHTIVGAGSKTDKGKTTPIVFSSKIVDVLQTLSDGRQGLLYPNGVSFFYKEFDATMDALGLEGKPYKCRRTFASRLAEVEPNTEILKDAMRHTNIQTTQSYITLDTEPIRQAVDKI